MATTDSPIFESFIDYWYFAKSLSDHQRELIFTSLPHEQRIKIEKSYEKGGWHDVLMRDELNKYIDEIKEKDNYDLLDIRCRVLKGKSVYLPRKFWEKIIGHLDSYKTDDTDFVLGGIKAFLCKKNRRVVLLLRDGSRNDE
tara:strand:+ start:1483 stop:1905 length:423 start_codon:yes stop_codon:yes gene_type:complete